MDRDVVKAHLALAEHHVAEGERILVKQLNLIERVEAAGGDVQAARALLRSFEETQLSHIADRDRLKALTNG